jgi:hypothetical protein
MYHRMENKNVLRWTTEPEQAMGPMKMKKKEKISSDM